MTNEKTPAPQPDGGGKPLHASDLEFENGRLVKIQGSRPEYADGYRLIEYVRQLAALAVSASLHKPAAGLDRVASIAALQEWSAQKYATPFSVSACHDLLGVLVLEQPIDPVAWVTPGADTARDDGFIDAKAWQEGEFTKPLYAGAPPPVPRASAKDVAD